jgi:hypothetical protein
MKLNKKQESNLAIFAAILVLLTAMVDPRISLSISLVALLLMAIIIRR